MRRGQDGQTAILVPPRHTGALFVHLIRPSVSRPGGTSGDVSYYIDEPLEVHGAVVRLRLDEGLHCTAAMQLDDASTLAVEADGGCARVALNPFRTHAVVRFDVGG